MNKCHVKVRRDGARGRNGLPAGTEKRGSVDAIACPTSPASVADLINNGSHARNLMLTLQLWRQPY